MRQRVGGCRCPAVIRIARKLVRFRMLKQRRAGKITCGRREGAFLSGAKKEVWRFLGGFIGSERGKHDFLVQKP